MEDLKRRTSVSVVSIACLVLAGCFDGGGSSSGSTADGGQGNLTVEFTNPTSAGVIQTPDIVVNVTGKVNSGTEVSRVEWSNDRGGRGVATGTDSWATGNIVLQLGENNITVTATDVNGAKNSRSLLVERENTTPSAPPPDQVEAELMYSYQADLANAAPVENAQILAKTVYFFVSPGTDWTGRGIDDIQILCCKGQAGPGQGDPYSEIDKFSDAPWSRAYDLSGYAPDGTRRVRITATFADGSSSGGDVFDFTVASASRDGNTAPLLSGTPAPSATVDVQYSFRPQAQDPDGDTMRYTVRNKPSWASFNETTGRLYGTPAETDTGIYEDIVISVSDGQTTSSLMPFAIEVEAFSFGSATLSWSIPTKRTDGSSLAGNLAGYHVYYGQTSRDYANKITLNNAGLSSYIVDNLSAGRWYFVVTAFDKEGIESNPSEEGSKLF
jgi:hypothetical protein